MASAVSYPSSMKPFQTLPVATLPERPTTPHPYYELESRDVVVPCDWGPLRSHVRCGGQGPPLLLLHGLMTAGYSWRYVVRPLGEHFRLFIVDFPSAGRSERSPRGTTPADVSRWLSALVDALGIRGTRVIGNSMGGYLAMGWAMDDPGAMSRLVNLHSPGFPEPRLYALHAAMKVPGVRRVLRSLIEADPRRWVQRNVHYYDETLKSLEELDEYGAPLLGRDGAAAFARILRDSMSPYAMEAFVARLERERFPVPLQLVYARQDPLVPPTYGERFAALVPEAELVWLERGSHFAHVDAPDLFVEAVMPFLEGPSEEGASAVSDHRG